MTTDEKLRNASASVREAREQGEFTVQSPGRIRPLSGARIAIAAVVAVLLVVGFPLLVLNGSGRSAGNDASGSLSPAPTVVYPPPTVVYPPPDAVSDTRSAAMWGDAVAKVVESAGIAAHSVDAWETPTPVALGGSLSALAKDAQGQIVLLADFQAFAPGEYRADPELLSEVAGSTVPGTEIPEGTVFRFEVVNGNRAISLVTEAGILYVLSGLLSDTSGGRALLTFDEMEAIAVTLVGHADAIVSQS